jgi:hypothetical protein
VTASTSTLGIAPRTMPIRVRDAVSTAESPMERDGLVGFDPTTTAAFRRATQADYFAWLEHIRPASACTRPIRLSGQVLTVQSGTGAVLSTLDTASMPDGVIYKACGNRRASVCPACARTYQYDAYQLLRAGLSGGKGVPETVATHPAVFVTLTAPSFGLVHTRVVHRHTCTNRRRCDCRPEPCHARTGGTPNVCQHGQPLVCWARHASDDPRLGQPLCLDCYDHDHQAVFNAFAGELFRRTKQNIQRHLVRLAKARGIPGVLVAGASGNLRRLPPVQATHGKVAEMQRRGVVHFHAILRLDGVDGTDSSKVVTPPPGLTIDDLHAAVRAAAARSGFASPSHPDRPGGWVVDWGTQVDIRTITLTGTDQITDAMVAGYLAKYATKSTEVTGHNSARITPDTIGLYADPEGDHNARLIDACWRLGRPTRTATLNDSSSPIRAQGGVDTQPANKCDPVSVDLGEVDNPYGRLRRWAHILGFGGHFLTKGRHYSTTFAVLRAARATYQRGLVRDLDHEHAGTGPVGASSIDDPDDEDTVLLVGSLSYAGTGWRTSGDALLAATAADLARSRHLIAREELAHELGTEHLTRTAQQAA